jgi:hypothetical protein
MTQPITPAEVAAYQAANFPSYVFDAFNELIASKYVPGRDVIITQKEAVDLIFAKANKGLVGTIDDDGLKLTRNDIYNKGYLNIEAAYDKQGWVVNYDKPGYDESYDAFFKFKVRK